MREGMVVACGRHFGEGELQKIRGIIGVDPPPNRRRIATLTCEALDWFGADGRAKEMSCRVALLRLARKGLIELPPPTCGNGNRKPYISQVTIRPPDTEIAGLVRDLGHLQVGVVCSRADSRLWNEAIARFHYLGFRPLPGAQIRYLVRRERDLVSVVGFGAAAWKVAARDQWIGWSTQQRETRLHLIVNNARFLILPWVRVRNLASWTLATVTRRLQADWEGRYGYRPVLAETFVERERFFGTCYRGCNWRCVGETQGRGKLDRHRLRALPVKLVFVYPLQAEFRKELCS